MRRAVPSMISARSSSPRSGSSSSITRGQRAVAGIRLDPREIGGHMQRSAPISITSSPCQRRSLDQAQELLGALLPVGGHGVAHLARELARGLGQDVDVGVDHEASLPISSSARARLGGGHAGVVEEAELESGPGCGIVAADDVAPGRRREPPRYGYLDGKREVAGAQVQAGRGGYEDVGAAAVEHGAVRRQVHPAVRAVVAASGVIAAVAGRSSRHVCALSWLIPSRVLIQRNINEPVWWLRASETTTPPS